MLIQKLRLKRGWSQQQLAQASGLSVRTIQRIESGQPASLETLMSLAAVLEVSVETLNQEASMNPSPLSERERQEQAAFDHVRQLRQFYRALFRSVGTIILLWLINLVTTPIAHWGEWHRLWAVWPTLGLVWFVLLRGVRVFGLSGWMGPEWERRQVEKRLGRPL